MFKDVTAEPEHRPDELNLTPTSDRTLREHLPRSTNHESPKRLPLLRPTSGIEFRPIPLSNVIAKALAAEISGFGATGIAVEVDLQPVPPLMLEAKMKAAILPWKDAGEAIRGGGCPTNTGRLREQEETCCGCRNDRTPASGVRPAMP